MSQATANFTIPTKTFPGQLLPHFALLYFGHR